MPAIRKSARTFLGALTTTPVTDAPASFDSPVQVRTSSLAILTASFVPAAVITLVEIPLFATLFSTWQAADWSTQILKMAISSYLCMVIALITLLPAVIVAGIIHALARSLQRTHSVDYAMIGAIVSFVAASMMYSYLPTVMLVPVVILAGALMGAAYRLLAGLEPLSRSRAVRAAVPRRQAREHRPARRNHAVIING